MKDDPLTRDIPVIAITATAAHRDVVRGKAAGFVDYLAKPIDFVRFFDILGHCLLGCMETEA